MKRIRSSIEIVFPNILLVYPRKRCLRRFRKPRGNGYTFVVRFADPLQHDFLLHSPPTTRHPPPTGETLRENGGWVTQGLSETRIIPITISRMHASKKFKVGVGRGSPHQLNTNELNGNAIRVSFAFNIKRIYSDLSWFRLADMQSTFVDAFSTMRAGGRS